MNEFTERMSERGKTGSAAVKHESQRTHVFGACVCVYVCVCVRSRNPHTHTQRARTRGSLIDGGKHSLVSPAAPLASTTQGKHTEHTLSRVSSSCSQRKRREEPVAREHKSLHRPLVLSGLPSSEDRLLVCVTRRGTCDIKQWKHTPVFFSGKIEFSIRSSNRVIAIVVLNLSFYSPFLPSYASNENSLSPFFASIASPVVPVHVSRVHLCVCVQGVEGKDQMPAADQRSSGRQEPVSQETPSLESLSDFHTYSLLSVLFLLCGERERREHRPSFPF